jgi:hypothetical protein
VTYSQESAVRNNLSSELGTKLFLSSRRIVSLKNLLAEKRSAILDSWLKRALEVYPAESRVFFRNTQDPFSNPIGSTLRGGMEKIYQAILQPADRDQAYSLLDPIIRIRAVQNLSPSQAISFIPLLKESIEEVMGNRTLERVSFPEWTTLSQKIDWLTLQAFDIYMECREKIHYLRMKEFKNRVGKIQEEERPEPSSGEKG